MLMAVSVDAGISSLWRVERVPALIVNLERGAESLATRLGRVNRVLGLDGRRPLFMLNARGRSLQDVMPAAERFVRREGIGFVVLDSISRSGFGDLKEDRVANAIVDALNRLCPTWLAVAHTPRSDETHEFVSVHFQAGEDVGIRLTSQEANSALPSWNQASPPAQGTSSVNTCWPWAPPQLPRSLTRSGFTGGTCRPCWHGTPHSSRSERTVGTCSMG
jgi:hypothetical protein